MNESQEYTLRWRGRETGPYPLEEINRQLDEHEIGTGHEIFYEDCWITLEEFFTAQTKAAAPPPPPPPPLPAAPTLSRDKPSPLRIKVSLVDKAESPKPGLAARALRPRHRLIFALLGVFAGFLGAHNFYARQWLTGLLQLLLSIATCLMGFGIIASWLWAVIEAVFVHKDGEGIDMI